MENKKSRAKSQEQKTPQKKGGINTTEFSKLKFEYLTQARAQQAAHLYTQSFLHMNTLWKSLGANYNEVFSVNRGRMLACCKAGWTCVMADPRINKILAVAPSMDMLDYIDTKSMPNNSLFLQTLGKYAVKLQRETFEKLRPTLKRGDCLYNYGGAVTPQFINGGISKKFWSIGLTYVKTAGFKVVYFRTTNRASTHLLVSFGAKVVNVVHITEPGVQNEFMELIRLDVNQLSFDTLTKYYEDMDPSVEADSEN